MVKATQSKVTDIIGNMIYATLFKISGNAKTAKSTQLLPFPKVLWHCLEVKG
jgi:hypothetical protein